MERVKEHMKGCTHGHGTGAHVVRMVPNSSSSGGAGGSKRGYAAPPRPWTCRMCTYFNESNAGRCDMCGTARGRAQEEEDEELECGLTPAQIRMLSEREISPNDFDLRLNLDKNNKRQTVSSHTLSSLSCRCAENSDCECGVCLFPINKGEKLLALPCRHTYHPDCIEEWLSKHKNTCDPPRPFARPFDRPVCHHAHASSLPQLTPYPVVYPGRCPVCGTLVE